MTRKVSYFLLLTLCFLALQSAYPQASSLINYSIREGLPSNEVYNIFQDKEGFIWFATDNGVVKFDGEDLRTYHIKDGLSDPVVFGFQEDTKDRIWFRSFSGNLSYYDYKSKKITHYKYNDQIMPFVRDGLLNAIYIDEDETVWLSTFQNFGKIDSTGVLTVTKKLEPKSLNFQSIGTGYLLGFSPAGHEATKLMVNNEEFSITQSETQSANHVISTVAIGEEIFFSLSNDIFCFKDHKVKKIYTAPSPIINISKDNSDNLWIGLLNSGVVKMNSKTFTAEPYLYLKDKSVSKTFQDRDGNFWFSTLENGVYFIPNLEIKISSLPEESKIKAVILYNKEIIVGGHQGILYFLNSNKQTNLHSPIICFFIDPHNKLWVSTNSDVYLFNEQFEIEKKIPRTTKTGFSSDGKFVWGAGTISDKLTMNGTELKTFTTGVYRSILVNDSVILLSGRLGLEVRDKDFNLLDKPKELEPYKITGITSLNKDIQLLSTIGNGMLLLKNLKLVKKFNLQNGFIADNIYGVIKKDSSLWIGTEKGLIKVDIESLINEKLVTTQLSKKNGLFENKINFLTATDKVIWAFSENGISLIPMKEVGGPKNNPKFYLRSILVNNQDADSSFKHLNHNQNNIEIRYGFLSFNIPEIFVRFRLSKTDQWIYTQERALRFFSLNPGVYSLQIEFSADNHNWIRGENLNFAISPPWWTIWYVQLVISIAILASILIYFQLQLKFSKQKQVHLKTLANHQQELIQSELQSVEKERNRIAKDLHDGVGTSLLTLKMMVGHTVEKQSDKDLIEERFQDTFGELKNVILDLSPPGLDRYGLLAGIHVYVDKIKDTLPIKIELYTFGDEINDKKVSPLLFRIIQELLSNSIKHSKAGLIKIQINSFKDLINIIFEDNGQGFKLNQKEGVGLGSIKFRIDSLKGTYDIQSSPSGSSFVIDIPLTGS